MERAGSPRTSNHRWGIHPRPPRYTMYGGVALFVWFAGWSVSGPAPAPTPGSAVCTRAVKATTVAYLTGSACPPPGFASAFGYEPDLVRTPSGWRYTR
ncbi:MAG TPA: hypothetical protein VEO00_11770, partial [Actinomycetota bacterium]|nr:hypothetical protein [Actinomycetota bacterium]